MELSAVPKARKIVHNGIWVNRSSRVLGPLGLGCAIAVQRHDTVGRNRRRIMTPHPGRAEKMLVCRRGERGTAALPDRLGVGMHVHLGYEVGRRVDHDDDRLGAPAHLVK